MAHRITITQTKTKFTPAGIDFYNPSDEFKIFFEKWINSGHMTQIQNTVSADGLQKVSIVEFTSLEKLSEFIETWENIDYVTLRNYYNELNFISFNREDVAV
jgi:hypothetical protein